MLAISKQTCFNYLFYFINILEFIYVENAEQLRSTVQQKLKKPNIKHKTKNDWKLENFFSRFYAPKQNASRVFAIVWASVRPSVRPSHS